MDPQNQIELEDKVYSFDQLVATGFDVDSFSWNEKVGMISGTLVAKCWGRKKQKSSLIACVVTDFGERIKFSCWAQRTPQYLGMRDILIGSKIEIEFVASKKSNLANAKKVREIA